jgi:hypothetical protein
MLHELDTSIASFLDASLAFLAIDFGTTFSSLNERSLSASKIVELIDSFLLASSAVSRRAF